MSSSEDSYVYENYSLELSEDAGPPLIKKRSRLIAAVVQNEVDILRDLLDSPKWYNVKDKYGYSLLQIAILRDNKEVFDYMLFSSNFPLEFVNKYNETALMVALTGFVSNDIWMDQHFAYELIKKGACIDWVCDDGNTPLHCALERNYSEVALLLIKMGVDLNACNDHGLTPIMMVLCMSEVDIEVLSALLVEGAVPSVSNFERSVGCDDLLTVQELLFLHSVDQYSEINCGVLFNLAINKSPLFDEVLKSSCKIVTNDQFFSPSCRDLCSMEPNYLKLIIQRFYKIVAEVLQITPNEYWFYNKFFHLECLDVLLENGFKFDVIDSLGMLNGSKLFENMLGLGYDESRLSEVYLYLLSYGLVLHEEDLQLVYCKFGYCELFKMFLHMDIELNTEEIDEQQNIVPVFFYDVTMSIPKFLENRHKFSYESINQLFDYFVHPGLTELYYELADEDCIPKRDKMQHIPSLLELARNSFRKYFIDTFQITTTRKFYTLLRRLPVSTAYKRIISYETKLY